MDQSQLRFYSYGQVASNKALNSHEVEVYPAEILPYVDGEVNFNPTIQEAQGQDSGGVEYATKVISDNTVTATWLPIGQPNRLTSPDVRRGERVMIWQYADTDQYYWCTCQLDQRLRKLETVVWAFSGTTDEGKDSTDPENCYTLEVSTHTGQITLRTVKANGEPFAYTCQFNTREGRVVLKDDVGNWFGLDSAKTLIQMRNRMKTYLELNKEDINMEAPRDIFAKASRDVTIKAGRDVVVDGGRSATLSSGGTHYRVTPSAAYIHAPKLEATQG